MTREITHAIIIPSYNEQEALPSLLKKLVLGLSAKDSIIVVDDSETTVSQRINELCLEILDSASCHFSFVATGSKGGRGAAVRKGMIFADNTFPNLQFVLECDADESHRAEDILKILRLTSNSDLVIGSRYMKESAIRGWPISRRIFSFFLNVTIPRIVGIKITDITNGLRRYSRSAYKTVICTTPINAGFIYLTEQAVLVSDANLSISEVPITFENRVLGQSTVTSKEILDSLKGIIGLGYRRMLQFKE
jgi:dolichol-phosphate mannosyltransferase